MILDDVQWIVARSRHVQIDESSLNRICDVRTLADLRLPDWQHPVVPPLARRTTGRLLLFGSINFWT
jgi:hypothetical protein